jgi:Tfp pilus assembly protein PilX
MKRTTWKIAALRRPARQRGITLVMALIMLVLLTLMAITAFHIGTSQTVIVSNAQHREEAVQAAQQAIDSVLNSPNFMTNPSAAIINSNSSCASGAANNMCVDVNGDGTADITVALSPKPACVEGWNISNSNLNLSTSNGLACSTGQSQTFGVEGSTNTNSLCAQTTWEVTAVATDSVTNTKATVVQGASAMTAATNLTNYCN